ncbi:Glucan endo-1,3-beta-glucosidase [Melia azedarach]|uniref:Glucan endo-1,3-beta-glucosidase n=1 Tax=Melia azedarach TaxID=155640 RepID=A0ACC1WYG9_MELAZ|nr:Glucan endo-1,3-beta-glucosidase [Melia azedarach]
MGSIVLQCLSIFLLHLFLTSGSSVAEKPQLEATQENRKLEGQEKRMLSSTSLFTTQLDADVPIVNPTTPGTNPGANPGTYPGANPGTNPGTTPTNNPATSPPSPAITGPTNNPVTSPPSPTITGPTQTPPAPTTPTGPATSGGSWCIASRTASETALQVALDYACGYGGADCSAIQQGASCYNPNTVRDHASYAFNEYYHKNPAPTSCDFGGTAQLTNTDPSNGNCRYASSTASTSTTQANPPPSPTMTTPTTTTPMTPSIMTPDGSTVYGAAEPTGLPSSATSVSCSLLLLLAATGFLGSLVENYL